MASVFRTDSGWRVQVRLKGKPTSSKVFRTKAEAVAWGRDQGAVIAKSSGRPDLTYREIAAKYGEFSREGSKSKRNVLKRLEAYWGDWRMSEIGTQAISDYALRRRRDGAGPPGVLQDLTYLGTVIAHGGVLCENEEAIRAKASINAAIKTLRATGTIADSQARSRRPTEDELVALEGYFAKRARSRVPMMDLVLFAIATTMRLGEIVGPGGLRWENLDEKARMIWVRNRKDPRLPNGKDDLVPLLMGYFYFRGEVVDPLTIMRRQKTIETGRVFPWAENTVSLAFGAATEELGIPDLHFHDLRHDGISRLFEAGYEIPQVAVVSGHRSWKNLKRYTHINPATLHR